MTEDKIHRLPGIATAAKRVEPASEKSRPNVNLADMLLILESQSDMCCGYVDADTGAVYLISDDMEFDIDTPDDKIPDWALPDVKVARALEKGEGNYLPTPSREDIDEFEWMHTFAQSYENRLVSDRIQSAIGGRGTFRRFRDTVRELNLLEKWEGFRAREFERVAVEWCEANGFGYDPAALTWLDSAKPTQEPAEHHASVENAKRLLHEPVFTHVTWRAKAGLEQHFIDAWNVLGDLFIELEHPPIEVTLIRSADDPTVFHSIGSWRSLADAQSVGDNARAIDAIANITTLCDDGMPSVFEIVRTVRPE